MEDYRHEVFRMGNADAYRVVLDIRFTIVMVAEIDLFIEHCIEQGTYCQPLLPERFAADKGDFLHLVGRCGAEFFQLGFRLGDFPNADFGFVFKSLF